MALFNQNIFCWILWRAPEHLDTLLLHLKSLYEITPIFCGIFIQKEKGSRHKGKLENFMQVIPNLEQHSLGELQLRQTFSSVHLI